MSLRQTAETAASATSPVPLGISGLTVLGVTIKDWVLMGTAVLLVFQLVVMAPKFWRIVCQGYNNLTESLRGTIYGKSNNRPP